MWVIIIPEILENELLSVVLDEAAGFIGQRIELKDGKISIPILSNIQNSSILYLNDGKNSHFKALKFKNKTDNTLIYQLDDSELSIKLEITLSDMIHFKYDIKTKKKLSFSSVIAKYSILLGNDPDYTWVPHCRPKKDFVIPDHVFRSPVMIYKKGKVACAFMPDLKILGKNRPFPTFMDFNLKSEETGGNPWISFGFGKYKPVGHIMFKHDPNKKMRIKPNTDFSFGYYIMVSNDKPILEILQIINKFLWETHGKELLYSDLAPQVLPYDSNATEGFNAIDRHDFWGNFWINEVECGGIWQKSWMGKKKKVKYMKPEQLEKYRRKAEGNVFSHESLKSEIIYYFSNNPFWIKRFDQFTRMVPIIERIAEAWNNAWFMNVRTGYGMKYFGELWQNDKLIDRGNRILNTLLNLSRTNGVFPSILLPAGPESTEISTINGVKAFVYTDDFHVVDSCLAMYWALKFYQDFEKREEILEKSNELLKLLEEEQLENGAIPTYIGFEKNNGKSIISDILINSASSGAPLMFLAELHKITKNERIIPVAEKIAKYLRDEILPDDKWHDFEPFFSCTHVPMDFYDDYTKSHAMNALCIYWCAEGFKELYKITGKEGHLSFGERILAILSLFQQVWNLPYISYNTFGGFGSQNIDAELSDARQGLFVRVYMEYYLVTGKKEYMERAIATLRACWAMQLIRENKEQCPGNLKDLGTLDGVDRGCITENYGHSGHDLRVPGYLMFDWGVGTSTSATAYVKKHFGDVFIDFKEKIVWGIDGIKIESFEFIENQVKISSCRIPHKDYILFKARESPENCEIILDGISIGLKNKKEMDHGFKFEIK